MEFNRELREGVISGEVTVSVRLWHQPKVKLGGRYRIGSEYIEIDSIEMMPFSSVTSADVRRSGETDRESLRKRAAHSGPIFDDSLVYRVEFHVLEHEPG